MSLLPNKFLRADWSVTSRSIELRLATGKLVVGITKESLKKALPAANTIVNLRINTVANKHSLMIYSKCYS